jgi:hypothetical protein
MRYDAKTFLEGLFREPDPPVRPSEPDPRDPIGPDDLFPDCRDIFEERAAIMEYDGGLSLEHAEAAALADILRIMNYRMN